MNNDDDNNNNNNNNNNNTLPGISSLILALSRLQVAQQTSRTAGM